MPAKKYQSIPTEVFAEQYWYGKNMDGVYFENNDIDKPFVINNNGLKQYIKPGDYVVQEEDGIHHYAMPPHVFKILYMVGDD